MRISRSAAVLLRLGLVLTLALAAMPLANAAGQKYTLSLDPDASEYTFARIPDRQVEEGVPVGSLPVLSRGGYRFGGWFTGEVGEGEQYTSSKIMPAHDVYLYAYWYVGSPKPQSNVGDFQTSAVASDGATVTSVLTKDDTEFAVQMPKGGLSEGGPNLEVEVDAVVAKVTFDGAALASMGSASGDASDITLAVATIEAERQSDRVKAVTGGRPVYDFKLHSGETQLSSLGAGSAVVRIPYELAEDEDPNALVIYYIDDAGNPHVVRSGYNAESKSVNFKVSHFSQYAVGYNKVAFSDVPEEAPYYDAVSFCAARGITTGTDVGVFSPDQTLTRGQFITMIMRAYGIAPDENPADNFADAGNDYYTGYLAAAKRLGISNGVGDNLFAPDANLSTQDMLTLLHRTLGAIGESPNKDTGKRLADFSDSGEVADYALEAVESMVVAGAAAADGNELNPEGDALRSAMTQALYALLSE